jgi:hypothetical protein
LSRPRRRRRHQHQMKPSWRKLAIVHVAARRKETSKDGRPKRAEFGRRACLSSFGYSNVSPPDEGFTRGEAGTPAACSRPDPHGPASQRQPYPPACVTLQAGVETDAQACPQPSGMDPDGSSSL